MHTTRLSLETGLPLGYEAANYDIPRDWLQRKWDRRPHLLTTTKVA